jgi:hypothetical protein
MHVVTRGYLVVHCAVKDVRSFIIFLGKTQSVGNNVLTSSYTMLNWLSKQEHSQSFMMFGHFHIPLTGFVFGNRKRITVPRIHVWLT